MAWGTASNFYNYNRKCQAWVSITWQSNTTNVVYTVTGYARSGDGSGYYYASDFGVQVKLFYRINGGSWTELGSTTSVLDYGNHVGTITRNVTVNRTTAIQAVEFCTDAISTTNDWPTASAYLSDNTYPLQSYAVTYNANKPSAASGAVTNLPANQTKWYGQTLSLSNVKPALELYMFKSWNTKAAGSGTTYAPGDAYTSNAALTLYAQWELVYSYPQISNLSVIRCASNGSASEEGTYAKVHFAWSVDATVDGGTNKGKRYVISSSEIGSTSWTTLKTTTLSTTSGTTTAVVGGSLSTTKSYLIRVALTDTHLINGAECTTIVYSILSQAFVWISANPNHGLAIGKQATEANTFDIGIKTKVQNFVQTGGGVILDSASVISWLTALSKENTFSPTAGNWSASETNLNAVSGVGIVNLSGTSPTKPAWTTWQIGTASVKPKIATNLYCMYQDDNGSDVPLLAWIDTAGRIYLKTHGAAKTGEWTWISGSYAY